MVNGTKVTPIRLRTVSLCDYCDEMKKKGESHFPPHDASPRCESGKKDHCTCDVCF